jgi:hypothetical protein
MDRERQRPSAATMDQPATTTGLQLRRRVLAALEDIYSPLAAHDELRPLLEELHQQPVSTAALDDLMAEELRAFDAGVERPVWLCRGIRPDLHGDLGSWARSDWAPWVRVVHPDSRLVREYWLLRQLWWVLPSDAEVHPSPLTDLFIRKAKLRRPRRSSGSGAGAALTLTMTGLGTGSGSGATSSRRTCSTGTPRKPSGVTSRSPMRWSSLTAEPSSMACRAERHRRKVACRRPAPFWQACCACEGSGDAGQISFS